MFHLQATCQQTLVFTPMLIKVNYFVVWGHWYKTCGLLGLCYIQKFKISRCIQHQLMAYVCFPVRLRAYFQLMFESLLLCQAKCLLTPGRLFFSFFHHLTFMGAKHFSLFLRHSLHCQLLDEKSHTWKIQENLHLSLSVTNRGFPERRNLTNPSLQFLFYFLKDTSQLGPTQNNLKRTF